MRSLNYVQRVSLDFAGTLFPHAICLGDADNDSVNKSFINFLFVLVLSRAEQTSPVNLFRVNQQTWERMQIECRLKGPESHNCNVYNVIEVILQRQKYFSFP